MNELVEKLEKINLDKFYCVTLRSNYITLQGTMSKELIEYCKEELGVIDFTVSVNNYLEGKVDNIEITLT